MVTTKSIVQLKSAFSLSEWQVQVTACQESGKTVKAWCEEDGISPATYYNGEEPEYKEGKFRRWVKVRETMNPEQKKEERQKRSKPILEDFFTWIESLSAAPKSKLEKAINYAKNEKVYLSRFLEDGRIPISNNRAENAIRPHVIGRKNWLFNVSEIGAENQAILYSIITTAKANGLNVEEYLLKIFSSDPGTVIMPWD